MKDMKHTIRNWTAALLFVATFGGATLVVATPQPTYACSDRLLTFPAWYRGLQIPDQPPSPEACNVKSPTTLKGGIYELIWTIALNIVEFMLQLVGYVSVGFIIVGGFKYMTSSGSPDGMSKSKKTIMNAVIGLVISIFSVAIVNVVSGALHG